MKLLLTILALMSFSNLYSQVETKAYSSKSYLVCMFKDSTFDCTNPKVIDADTKVEWKTFENTKSFFHIEISGIGYIYEILNSNYTSKGDLKFIVLSGTGILNTLLLGKSYISISPIRPKQGELMKFFYLDAN